MYSKARSANKNISATVKPGPVTLALQLASGERLTGIFPPESTLWEILEHWESENKLDPPLKHLSIYNDIPTCIYMRKEISTEKSLKSTTLLQLEIFNGRAAIRYATKTEGVINQAHVGGNIEKTPRPVTPEPAPKVSFNPLNEQVKVEMKPDDQEPTKMVKEEIEQELEKEVEASISKVTQNDVKTEAIEGMETEAPSEQSSNTVSQKTFVDDCDTTVHFLNERGDLVYRRPVDEPVPPTASFSDDPGDAFFELTEEEIRRRMAELVQNSKQLNNAPLMTSQLRKQQEEERRQQLYAKYPTTVLRIQFPDSFILQLPLPTMSTIFQVKREVQNYVEDDHQDIVLFTTPPKQVLENNDLSLLELGLSPSSMIYISGRILKEQYRNNNQISSYFGAVRDASNRLFTGNSDSEEMEVEETRTKRQAPSTGTSTSANKTSSNVPKWLKLKR